MIVCSVFGGHPTIINGQLPDKNGVYHFGPGGFSSVGTLVAQATKPAVEKPDDPTASVAPISAADKVKVEKLEKVKLVSADTPDKTKGRPQTCHVWISMSDTDPKDQIIVWFEKTPTQADIDDARQRELDMRAKMKADMEKMKAEAAKEK